MKTETFSIHTTFATIEKALIIAALRVSDGNRIYAARLLGMGERSLYRKIKKYRVKQ